MEVNNFGVWPPQNNRTEPGNVSRGGWSCSECGENMSAVDLYCRKCGAGNPMNSHNQNGVNYPVPKKSNLWKWLLTVFLTLFLLAGTALGWYFWQQHKQKKEAKNYLINEGKAFDNVISLMNALSTEKDIEIVEDDDSGELLAKKIAEEKDRADRTLQEIKITGEKNKNAKVNKYNSKTDFLLKQFYSEAEEKITFYDQYVNYENDVQGFQVSASKEFSKLDVIFKNPRNESEFLSSMKEGYKIFKQLEDNLKAITPPPGLEDFHNESVGFLDKFISGLEMLTSGIETKDIIKAKRGLDIIDEIQSDKSDKKISKLNKFYFSSLHEKITELRAKADDVKVEMVKNGSSLNVQSSGASIEGW